MKRLLIALAIQLLCLAPARVAHGQAKRPITLEDYFRIEDVGNPTVSPDGECVVFVRSRTLREENRGHSGLWIVPADGSASARRLSIPSFNASSPIVHASGVSTPTLFVHGESDHRVPIEEAEQMYVALQKQGVPARFIRYPESFQGGWTPWRLMHRYWASLSWWEVWLGEEG